MLPRLVDFFAAEWLAPDLLLEAFFALVFFLATPCLGRAANFVGAFFAEAFFTAAFFGADLALVLAAFFAGAEAFLTA